VGYGSIAKYPKFRIELHIPDMKNLDSWTNRKNQASGAKKRLELVVLLCTLGLVVPGELILSWIP